MKLSECFKISFLSDFKASDVINLIDESVSPCDDFYKFACGGWIQSTTIPDETGHMSIFEQSRERLDIQLKG